MRYLPHIYEKTIFLLALTMDRSMTAFAPLLLPLLSFLSVLCCYQYQFYDLIFVIEIISKLPYLLSISFLYFHMTRNQIILTKESGRVPKNLTASKILQISIALCQIKAKIHSFPTMYIIGGGKFGLTR